jgi:hypothetical protein
MTKKVSMARVLVIGYLNIGSLIRISNFVIRIFPSGYFRLEPQDIAIFNADIAQALVVEQLLAAGAVVELVTENLTVGGVLREVHLLEQYRQDAVDGRIIGHVHLLAFVACRIPNMDTDYRHPGNSRLNQTHTLPRHSAVLQK